jgi:C_GCAxxG_C_C family probable redox protein
MDKATEAYNLIATGRLNCAQAVLGSFAPELGLEGGLALRLTQGFGSGMGRSGNTCGAATGAFMVLGLAHKIDPANPRESLEKTYALVQEFSWRFVARHGTLVCRELINYDLSRPESLAAARQNQVFVTVCPNFVKSSVEIVEALLALSTES